MRQVKIGVVGCGMINSIYLKNCTQTFDILDVIAVADLVPELAQQRAAEFKSRAPAPSRSLNDPEIEIVLNLTTPKAHWVNDLDTYLAAGGTLPELRAVVAEAGIAVVNAITFFPWADAGRKVAWLEGQTAPMCYRWLALILLGGLWFSATAAVIVLPLPLAAQFTAPLPVSRAGRARHDLWPATCDTERVKRPGTLS